MEKLPYITLLCAFALIYLPRMFVAREQARQPEGYDNANPRTQQAKLSGMGARAQAAHLNSFESFAPFAAGILVCETANLDSVVTGYWGLVFVFARIVYIALYLGNLPMARSSVWGVGFLAVVALLVRPIL